MFKLGLGGEFSIHQFQFIINKLLAIHSPLTSYYTVGKMNSKITVISLYKTVLLLMMAV